MSDTAQKTPQRRLDALPTAGFGLQVDGKTKSIHDTSEAAMVAGLDLKRRFPAIQVIVFDAVEGTRTAVELPEANPS